MIGQQANLTLCRRLIQEKRLPHFIIIHGGRMTGKKVFVGELIKELGMTSAEVGDSVDDIRAMIEDIYKSKHERVYKVFDLEDYNYRSKEAILKICEEPPEYSYLIVTVNNLSFLKGTLRNRAFVINIMPYSLGEMRQYSSSHSAKFEDEVFRIINTPSLFDYYIKDGHLKLYKAFFKDFTRIVAVDGGEAVNFIKYFNTKKDENDKMDFGLFLDWVAVYLSYYTKKTGKNVSLLASLVLRFKAQLNVNGVSLLALIPSFIIAFRHDCRKLGLDFVNVEGFIK